MRLFRRGVDGKSRNYQFMTLFEVPNFDNPAENYLTRLRIIQTPWFSVFLHRMDGPDSRPILHDHPWSFVSFVLKGGYSEIRLNKRTMGIYERQIKRLNIMRRDDAHYIRILHRTPTWTLVFTGVRRRTWGYWEMYSHGSGRPVWRWTEFDKHVCADLFDNAIKQRSAGYRPLQKVK